MSDNPNNHQPKYSIGNRNTFGFSRKSHLYLPEHHIPGGIGDDDHPKPKDTFSDALHKWITLLVALGTVWVLITQTQIMNKQADIMTETLPPIIAQAEAAKIATQTAVIALDETKKDRASTQRSFREQERAYVSTTFFTMGTQPLCPDIRGIHVCADVHIVNTGRTPAVGIKLHRYATFGPDSERIVKAMKIPNYKTPAGTALATNASQFGTTFTEVVDEKTANELINGSLRIVLYGIIQYFDIFDDYHETGFCAERVLKSTAFITCDYGNWFDKKPKQ